MPISGAKTIAAALPTLPGVYRFSDERERVLYVGKAKDLKKRVSSYFHQKKQSPRIEMMLQAAFAVDTIVTASEAEALLLENNLIKSLKPKYNILFRDDKTYPYLRLSKHPYPRLMFYRGSARGEDADYFGPFPDSNAVRETIDILQRVFRLRNCTDTMLATRTRPCLLHSIGRCSAPCTNKISPENYAADAAQARHFLRGGVISAEDDMRRRMEQAAAGEQFEQAAALRDRLRALAVVRGRHFADNNSDAGDYSDADYIGIHHNGAAACANIIMVRGGRRVGEKRLFPDNANGSDAESVAAALLAQHYRREWPAHVFISPLPAQWRDVAAHLRAHIVESPRPDARARLAAAADNARMALVNRGNRETARARQLAQLAQRLGLDAPPRRMECFDISHSMGEETVASRVVFADGAPDKRGYRLFRIRQNTGGDDYAAIGEAVGRCYRRAAAENTPLPDVLFIDGGAGQVSAALAALAEEGIAPPPLFGVAKGAARKPGEETLIAADGEVLQLPATDGALHLIQALRDEAHRFALSGHRRRRDKKRATSTALDGIEGIGAEKRRLLMNYFGGLPAIRAASAADLANVSGIGPALAARIYRKLH